MIDFQQTMSPIVETKTRHVARRIVLDETRFGDRGELYFFEKEITTFRATDSRYARFIDGQRDVLSTDVGERFFFTSFHDPVQMAVNAFSTLSENAKGAISFEAYITIRDFDAIALASGAKELSLEGRVHRIYPDHTVYVPIPSDWIDVTTPKQRKQAEMWMAATDFMEIMDTKPSFFCKSQTRVVDTFTVYSSKMTPEENIAAFENVLSNPVVAVGLDNARRADRLKAYSDIIMPGIV